MPYSFPIGNGTPNGYQQVTNSGTAGALTVPAGTTSMILAVSVQAIRFTLDGTNPTASSGMPVAVGDAVPIVGNIRNVRIISQTGTATVDVQYFK